MLRVERLENRELPSVVQPMHLGFSVTSPGGYSPQQLRQAYGITGNGEGQVIAIVDAYGDDNYAFSLRSFDVQFNLPDPQLNIMDQRGGQNFSPVFDPGWALESVLDVEWAHAVAPGATIDLILADTAVDTDMVQATDLARRLGIVSMSWGTTSPLNYDFTNGVYTAASGDSPGLLYPAQQRGVLAVGGTSLFARGDGAYQYESIWPEEGSHPAVRFDADPYTGVPVNLNGDWYQVGGTSLGSPCWAGIVADGGASGLRETKSPICYRSYVDAVFSQELGRGATPEEVRTWQNVSHFATLIAQSDAALSYRVDGWYQDYLGRHADPVGLATMVAALRAGLDVERAIALSPEASERAVDDIFTSHLHRFATDADRAEWRGHEALLYDTTLGQVVAGQYRRFLLREASPTETQVEDSVFLESAEFQRTWI